MPEPIPRKQDIFFLSSFIKKINIERYEALHAHLKTQDEQPLLEQL